MFRVYLRRTPHPGVPIKGLGFRGLGFKGLGFRGLGFKGLGFRGLGFKGLGFRGLGFRAIFGVLLRAIYNHIVIFIQLLLVGGSTQSIPPVEEPLGYELP